MIDAPTPSTSPFLPHYPPPMGGFRPAELVLLVAVVFFLGYGLALPIVGIVLAAGKKRRRARAT
jgi:hypothetical protein